MSTVIKAGDAGPLLRHLSTVDLADHLAEADAVMQHAHRQASRTLSRAQEEACRLGDKAKQQGYDVGFELGKKEGREAGHKQAYDEAMERFRKEQSEVVEAMRAAVTAIDTVKEDIGIAARRDMLEFAMSIARKLTFAIGESHTESARANLDRALRLVGSTSDLVIRANPQDITSLETFAESTLAHVTGADAVTLVPDEDVAPGGCKVVTERTRIDATLETQMDQIVRLVLGGRGEDD
ncbi:MAG: FliH/SctL family protein [Phycisphaerae bacterium]|jgi:flagellar assembly protein FliH